MTIILTSLTQPCTSSTQITTPTQPSEPHQRWRRSRPCPTFPKPSTTQEGRKCKPIEPSAGSRRPNHPSTNTNTGRAQNPPSLHPKSTTETGKKGGKPSNAVGEITDSPPPPKKNVVTNRKPLQPYPPTSPLARVHDTEIGKQVKSASKHGRCRLRLDS